ncbi:hypothetical protein BV22DRAFT_314638 [Leucogyrophana mollusca]|uniref:Uncharacterized protein n=1 Tax=Leucogyrophana mollusca TaxID=85980 RepID=A0ACB8BP92_9AGAM|nr:hypothetical protein BV22DRAFT_314638 [Leucogyrophana mollusca]
MCGVKDWWGSVIVGIRIHMLSVTYHSKRASTTYLDMVPIPHRGGYFAYRAPKGVRRRSRIRVSAPLVGVGWARKSRNTRRLSPELRVKRTCYVIGVWAGFASTAPASAGGRLVSTEGDSSRRRACPPAPYSACIGADRRRFAWSVSRCRGCGRSVIHRGLC